MTIGAVLQMAFAFDHSLPCSSEALALAAGVRNAMWTPMTTMMMASSGGTFMLVH